MRIIIVTVIFIGEVFILSAQQSTLKIMPLGDSITRGVSVTSDAFGRAGYRKPLIDSLNSLGYISAVNTSGFPFDFDFVGNQNQPISTTQIGVDTFDVNHQGHTGWQASNPANTAISLYHNLNNFLSINPPNIILLHIGTNDISAGDNVSNLVSEVSNILNSIYSFNSNINVILAQIINRADVLTGSPESDSTTKFNNALKIMADARIINGDKLYVVDMETGAGFTYMVGSSTSPDPFDMGGNLHPNNNGYRKIANVWFNKIKEILTPNLSSPVNDSTDTPLNITFKWNPAPGANTYRLQVSTDSTFNSNIILDDGTLIDTFYTINSLDYDTEYFWRVSGKINTGSSPYSSVRSFTTFNPVSVETEFLLENNLIFQNYPNPFNPSTVIKFALKSDAEIEVNIYDILGNKIDQIYKGFVNSNEIKEIVFNAESGLASGAYFYEITIDGEQLTRAVKKMILIK